MGLPRILVVDDEPTLRFALDAFLALRGYRPEAVGSAGEARARLQAQAFDALILDYALPDGNALDWLPRLRALDPALPVLVITAQASVELAVRAIQLGADQFLVKPLDLEAVHALLQRLLDDRRRRRLEAAQGSRRGSPPDLFKGASPAIRRLEVLARQAAAADCPVLILGATGTGKSELARWIHSASGRGRESLLELNCAGFSREFLDTELFGHERGAFTGAVAAKVGLLEAAHRGTVFLDELGDLDLALQPKLLKALEEKRFRRLGEVRDRTVDIRLIGATHRDLGRLAAAGAFREDLYYRLSALELTLPALAERPEDLPGLAQDLLTRIAADWGRPPAILAPDAVAEVQRRPWPGNVRELRNALERALLGAAGPELRAADLASGPPAPPPPDPERGLTLAEVERRHIAQVLAEEGGRVADAARRLDVPRSTLYQKLSAYGLTTARGSSSGTGKATGRSRA